MADAETEPDEIDKLIAADPHAHVVEDSGTEGWLLTGDRLKVARAALPKKDQ